MSDDYTPDEPMFGPDAASMVIASETLAQIIEIAAGHKSRAMAAGFSPTIAEQMAFGVHQGYMMKMFSC